MNEEKKTWTNDMELLLIWDDFFSILFSSKKNLISKIHTELSMEIN